jgi:hypothetical protein
MSEPKLHYKTRKTTRTADTKANTSDKSREQWEIKVTKANPLSTHHYSEQSKSQANKHPISRRIHKDPKDINEISTSGHHTATTSTCKTNTDRNNKFNQNYKYSSSSSIKSTENGSDHGNRHGASQGYEESNYHKAYLSPNESENYATPLPYQKSSTSETSNKPKETRQWIKSQYTQLTEQGTAEIDGLSYTPSSINSQRITARPTRNRACKGTGSQRNYTEDTSTSVTSTNPTIMIPTSVITSHSKKKKGLLPVWKKVFQQKTSHIKETGPAS